MLKSMLVAVATILASAAAAQNAPADSCADPSFHQFDFWLGEWSVTDSDGQFAGRNSITADQKGCVVMEHWHSAKGGTGMSMNFYDPHIGKWKQIWVGLGLTLEMTGELKAGSMVLEGPLYYLNDKHTTLLRGVWTPLKDGRVRQHFTESSDNGKTWAEWFDGYYEKKK